MNDNVEIKLSTLIRLSIQRWKLFIIILILTTSLVFSFNYIQKQKFTNLLVLKSPSNFYSADYLRTQRFLTLLNHHKFPSKSNFAFRWFEIDFEYFIIKLLSKLRIITLLK